MNLIHNILSFYEDSRKNNANLGCDYFQLTHHYFLSFFNRCYNFNLIKILLLLLLLLCKYNILSFNDWPVFTNLAWWWSERFWSHKFCEYFKSAREIFCSKLNQKQDFSKVTEWLWIFLTTPDEVEKNISRWCS